MMEIEYPCYYYITYFGVAVLANFHFFAMLFFLYDESTLCRKGGKRMVGALRIKEMGIC